MIHCQLMPIFRCVSNRGCTKLAILDLSEEQANAAGNALTQKLVAAGTADLDEIKAVGYGLDVSNEQSVKQAMDAVVARWGRIDCLVTAAGKTE